MRKYILTLFFIHAASSLAMCNFETLALIPKTPVASGKSNYFSIPELEQLKTDAQNKDTSKIEQALTRGFPVNQFLDENKTTLLMVAVTQENIEMVKFLLQNKAKPNTRNLVRWSALMFAARRGKTEIAKLLVTFGADKDARNQHGEKAWQIAERTYHYELAKELKPKTELIYQIVKLLSL